MHESSQQLIEFIVRSLEERGTSAAPVEEAIELANSDPDAVYQLALAVMERFPKGGTFLDGALSFLPEDKWSKLIEHALGRLDESSGENEAANSVIAYASLQSPPSLHSQLDRIFAIQPNSDCYYEFYPWRESGVLHFDHLRAVLEEPSSSDDDRIRGWSAMLQTRHPKVVEFACSHHDAVYSAEPLDYSRDEWLQAHLHTVGFDNDTGLLRRICVDALHHIRFPDSFFDDASRPPWRARIHPTWTLPRTGETTTFGGWSEKSCSLCGERLHRLVVLDPVLPRLGIASLERIEFATCLSCLGWEAGSLFYRHNEHGVPTGIGYDGPPVTPEFPVGPLKEAEVCFADTPRRWYWQDWGLSNGRENLNRIGGEPCWVQDADYPCCPSCQRVMSFILQLDSDLPTADGGEWLWGSGGIGYGFWCDGCKVSGFLWQCT
jgi:hypothetical protein